MDTNTNNLQLCVICCSAFNSASIISSDAASCRQHLVSFCKLLASSPPQPPQQLDDLIQSSFPGLDQFLEDSGMSVCSECHCTITVAMEMGTEVERKEKEIRKLQQEILAKMTELQTELDGFHEEMTKVEKCIENSDVSCLMYHMTQSPCQDENITNGIMMIRDRITEVMTDLRNFKEGQNQILNPETKLFDLEQLYSTPQVSIVEEDDDDDYISYVPAEEPEMIHGTEGLLKAGEVAPQFYGHTVFGDSGDYRFEPDTNSDQEDDFEAAASNAEDSDDSFVGSGGPPVDPTATPKTRNRQNPRTSSQPPLPKMGQGVFKKEVIEYVLARAKTRTPEMDASSDPLKKYYLRYDEETKKLFVGPIEVIVNEFSEILECTQCRGLMGKGNNGLKETMKQRWRDMEKNMVAHCIGRHLGGFPCQWCDTVSTSYSSLKLHWKRNHNDKRKSNTGIGLTGPKGLKPYQCNMCDERFTIPTALQTHFMKKHSKSIEKAENPKGIKPPKIRVKVDEEKGGGEGSSKGGTRKRHVETSAIQFSFPKKSKLRPHECHICKFAFKKSSHLKKHLDVHRKKGELV